MSAPPTIEEQASRLAEWLEQTPGAPPPEGVDPEVLQAVWSLRPDLAPAPRVTVEDILAGIETGPLSDRLVSLARERQAKRRDEFEKQQAAAAAHEQRRTSRLRPWFWSLGLAASAAAALLVVLPNLRHEAAPDAGSPPAPEAASPPPVAAPADLPAPVIAEAMGPAADMPSLADGSAARDSLTGTRLSVAGAPAPLQAPAEPVAFGGDTVATREARPRASADASALAQAGAAASMAPTAGPITSTSSTSSSIRKSAPMSQPVAPPQAEAPAVAAAPPVPLPDTTRPNAVIAEVGDDAASTRAPSGGWLDVADADLPGPEAEDDKMEVSGPAGMTAEEQEPVPRTTTARSAAASAPAKSTAKKEKAEDETLAELRSEAAPLSYDADTVVNDPSLAGEARDATLDAWNRATALQASGDLDAAIAALRPLMSQSSPAIVQDAAWRIAVLQLQKGHRKSALSTVTRGLATDSAPSATRARLLSLKGQILEEMGRMDEARKAYEEAREAGGTP